MKSWITTLLSILYFATGMAQNPLLIKQVNSTNTTPGESGSLRFFKHQQWNGKFFYSCNGTNGLCVTDGTTAGTQNIFTFTIPGGAVLSSISFLGPAQDFMYIRWRVQYAPVAGVTNIDEQLWRSDGTSGGTQLVFAATNVATSPWVFSDLSSDPSRPASIVGNTIFFRHFTPAEGQELWKSDGTTVGTSLVKDIRPGTAGSGPVHFGKIGNRVLFFAGDGVVGRELWSTDGTAAGTVLVKDINPDNSAGGADLNSGSDLWTQETGVCNGKYFFYATVPGTTGAEPWVSDGTEVGTFLLKDIAPGTTGSNLIVSQLLNDFLATDEYMFFRSKNLTTVNGNGAALWRSDGTPGGTILLSAADSLSNVSAVAATGSYKYMLLFNNSGSGSSLRQYFLISDGTPGGTKVVDSAFFSLGNPVIYNDAGYVSGFRSPSGGTTQYDNEILRTDGTKPGTGLALDVFPGAVSSPPFIFYNSATPQKFFVLNGSLYFFARNAASPFWGLFRYQGDFTFNNSTGNRRWRDSSNWNSSFPPGITDTVYINSGMQVQVDGRNAFAGHLVAQPGASITTINSTDSLFIHTGLDAATISGSGPVVFKNFFNDTVHTNSSFNVTNLVVAGSAGLGGAIEVQNQAILTTGARLVLNEYDFNLTGNTSTIQAATNAYLVTNNTGSMRVEGVGASGRTGQVFYPVGTITHYNPVLLSNSGSTDAFSIRVRPGISSTYTGEVPSGSPVTNGAVNTTWLIREDIVGGSSADLTFQWNGNQELPGFDRSQSRVGHFTGTGWTYGPMGAANGGDPYQWSGSGFSSFSPFGILNQNITLPATRMILMVRKVGATHQCSWDIQVDDGESLILERSFDGFQFTSLYSPSTVVNGMHDVAIIGNHAVYYYRLKMISTNGVTRYSNIVVIRESGRIPVEVYPNIVRSQVTIQYNGTTRSLFRLTSAMGQRIIEKEVKQGTNLVTMDGLPAGVYWYTLINNSGVVSSGKLIKQ